MANAHAVSHDDTDIASLAAMERRAPARPAPARPQPVEPHRVVVEHVVRVSQRDIAVGVCFGMIAFGIVVSLVYALLAVMAYEARSDW